MEAEGGRKEKGLFPAMVAEGGCKGRQGETKEGWERARRGRGSRHGKRHMLECTYFAAGIGVTGL